MSERRHFVAMAMDVDLEIVGDVEPTTVDALSHHLETDLAWVDSVFSTYREDSWISRINRGEASLADAPPALAEVLDLCESFRDETDGLFDARTPDGRIDPTGIVKTWALERSRWRLSLLGADGWRLACSGDVTVAGRAPTEAGWRIGLADPRHAPGPDVPVVGVVTLGAGGPAATGMHALATSGLAHRSGHIWDPRTGQPAAQIAQASVIGEDLVRCDAWATAVVVGGKAAARAAQRHGVEVQALSIVEGAVRASRTAGWRSTGS
ncbi:FAD:protein FMN transferase [Demequina sp. NBRC 110055]|uniref:FAD:protein FMN transferase n=1 Tax=Demequina sp. NBRC 110055 TaxID=1570344 RepID=UPI0009FEECFE|nr:FAD:protein FMN transferase [Demequina sp. NBRC 110055]